MNFMNIAQRTLGLILPLLLLVVGNVVPQIVGPEVFFRTPWPTLVFLALTSVACVVAGYFLRTFWALLIVPVVVQVGGYVVSFLINLPAYGGTPESFFQGAVFIIANEPIIVAVFCILDALLALLGVLLGKRSARTAAALAIS